MSILHRLQTSVFGAYVVWALVLLTNAMMVSAQSKWLASLPPDTSTFVSTMFWSVFGSLMVFGALLAWFTQENHSWARWLFMLLCAAYAVDCLLGTLAIGPAYENIPRPYGVFRGPISFAVWTYLVWLARWLTRPNLAVKRDAPQAARPLP